MDLHNYTVDTYDGDTEVMCDQCGPLAPVASSSGILGAVLQLPNPVTLSAVLAAATKHDAEVHPRG